jgi:hypothetical protein
VLSADGSAKGVAVGYATIRATAANTTAVAILRNVMSGAVVGEVGVAASHLLQNGRLYVDVLGSANVGLAIANPNDVPAVVSFFFTDSAGADFGAGTIMVPARGQISKFLSEAPFNSGAIRATFSFTSNVPLGVTGLRGLINERGEFLMSSVPVVDFAALQSRSAVFVPHFAQAGGWSTQIIFVNPSDSTITGGIALYGRNGLASTFGPDRLPALPYSIPPRSFVRVPFGGGPPGIVLTESIHIEPTADSVSPAAMALLTYKPGAFTISEAAVGASSGSAFRLYAASSGIPGAAGSIQTGVAVANASAAPATVTFELTAMDGTVVGQTSAPIAGNGQLSAFVNEMFAQQNVSLPAQGLLRVSSSGSPISVAAVRSRYNERGDFLATTLPVANEAAVTNSSPVVFPVIANGGGYATQFIVYSGSPGASGSGSMDFVAQNGTPLTIYWTVFQ